MMTALRQFTKQRLDKSRTPQSHVNCFKKIEVAVAAAVILCAAFFVFLAFQVSEASQ